jgi:hypothetical protein
MRRRDYHSKVVCQEVRILMARKDTAVRVCCANAKYKKRYLLGRRRWRYFIGTIVEKKKQKKNKNQKNQKNKNKKDPKNSKMNSKKKLLLPVDEKVQQLGPTETSIESQQVVVRRRYDQCVWVRDVIDKLYNSQDQKTKKVQLPVVPQPNKPDRIEAMEAMSEWVSKYNKRKESECNRVYGKHL